LKKKTLNFDILHINYSFFEILFYISFKFYKKKFKWLISKDDEFPKFDYHALSKFHKTSFDKDLGG